MATSPGVVVSPAFSTSVADVALADARGRDRLLVARIAAGDDDAIAELYDQYGALVFGVAAALVGHDRASDICQEVFLQLWDRPDRFDPDRGSLRTFLAMLARRRSVDLLRRRGRQAGREKRAARGAPAASPDIEEAAMAVIDAERVRGALGLLPPDQRQAIELAYFEGLTFRQVAAATGVAEGTAKSRLRLALARLQKALSDGGEVIGAT